MKIWLVLACVLAACVVLALLWVGVGSGTNGTTSPQVQSVDSSHRIDELEREIGRLRDELARSRTELESGPSVAGELEAPQSQSIAQPVERTRSPAVPRTASDPQAYLDEYIASFQAGAESEFYRLLVAAHVLELLPRLAGLSASPTTHADLRLRFVEILGDRRLKGYAVATGALLDVLQSAAGEKVHVAALNALKSIGDARSVAALEQSVWSFQSPKLRMQAIGVIAFLAGDRVHESLARLLRSAPDDAMRIAVLARLDPGRAAGALGVFELASTLATPVRLQAARAIDAYSEPEVIEFIARWLTFETDRAVRALLEKASQNASQVPGWHARQAIGPPDANAANDDPKAWASAQADMGEQWLELGYTPARRCHTVRIHEVNSAGAVVALVAIDEEGFEHALWSGVDPLQVPGVFEIRVPSTSYRVRRLRIVLNTDLRPDWNEIDCAEISGPDGSAWASEARASSSYASGG